MTDVKQISAFLLAGRACFTLVSRRTEKRYTFEVHRTANCVWRYNVAVLAGPNNETDFVPIAWIILSTDGRLVVSTKLPDSDARILAVRFLLRCLKAGKMHDQLEFHHAGTCGACGRRLTTPESLERGLGPECAARLGG